MAPSSVAAGERPPVGAAPPASPTGSKAALPGATDRWPQTGRLLPWMLAGFLVMLWVIPFDSVTLPIPLPVDSLLDRSVLPVLVVLWIGTMAWARPLAGSRYQPTAIDVFLALFFAWTALSLVNNLETLIAQDEFELGLKKVCVLLGYFSLFWIVATVVRRSELQHWCLLFVILATVLAIGVIYEFRTGTNVFFNWTNDVLPNSISVAPVPPDPLFGRELVSGPTEHAIATSAMLAMGLGFVLTGLMQAPTPLRKLFYAISTALVLAACFATVRKTGIVAPAAALITLCVYRPRAMVRLLPLGLVIVIAIQGLAPGAMVRVKAQFVGGGGFWEQKSVEGRTEDYAAIKPDRAKNLRWGRGHGTYDAVKYRFLDNEYLGRIIETGVVGLVVYLLLILAVIRVAHRASRSKDPVRARVGVACVAGAVVYLVTNFVFDALSFAQAPYLFLFLAGLAVVAAPRRGEQLTEWSGPVAALRGATPGPARAAP